MPSETQQAVDWTLKQTWIDKTTGEILPITKDMVTEVVDGVRQYFNENNIKYESFSYNDLATYLE